MHQFWKSIKCRCTCYSNENFRFAFVRNLWRKVWPASEKKKKKKTTMSHEVFRGIRKGDEYRVRSKKGLVERNWCWKVDAAASHRQCQRNRGRKAFRLQEKQIDAIRTTVKKADSVTLIIFRSQFSDWESNDELFPAEQSSEKHSPSDIVSSFERARACLVVFRLSARRLCELLVRLAEFRPRYSVDWATRAGSRVCIITLHSPG